MPSDPLERRPRRLLELVLGGLTLLLALALTAIVFAGLKSHQGDRPSPTPHRSGRGSRPGTVDAAPFRARRGKTVSLDAQVKSV